MKRENNIFSICGTSGTSLKLILHFMPLMPLMPLAVYSNLLIHGKFYTMKVTEFKTAFSDLVYDIVREDISDVEFQSIMKMIESLICDKKEKELLRILKFHFPEYYNRIKPLK